MKVLDETGMGVFWALVKEYIANHVEEVTNNYLPLSGGTLTGGLNINSQSGLTTTGRITTTSGLNTSTWKTWTMRNGGSDDEIAAIWYVTNDGILLSRVNPDDIDLSDPPSLFTYWYIDSDNNIHFSNSSINITAAGNLEASNRIITGDNSMGLKTTSWISSTMINNSGAGATGAYRLYCDNTSLHLDSIGASDVDISAPESNYIYYKFYDGTEYSQMQFANGTVVFNHDHDYFHNDVDFNGAVTVNGTFVFGSGQDQLVMTQNLQSQIINVEVGAQGGVVFDCPITCERLIQSSDISLKENIESIAETAINAINQVEFKQFNFKDDENKTIQYGIIAQDVESAGLENLIGTDSKENKTVDYTSLLILKIEALEKKIAELEAKINNQ